MSRKSRGLLIEVARCPIVSQCLAGDRHACSSVVAAQEQFVEKWGGPPGFKHQLPEPWRGHIESARILFVGSNPSFNPWDEEFPTSESSDAEIRRYFVDGFEQAFDPSVRYWRMVGVIARALLGPEARTGIDFALTEIVRCKSQDEKGLTEAAIAECSRRYFMRTLKIAAAPVIVPLGKKARAGVAAVTGTSSEIGLHRPVTLSGRRRWLLMLGHPSSGQRQTPTVDEISRVQPQLAKLAS